MFFLAKAQNQEFKTQKNIFPSLKNFNKVAVLEPITMEDEFLFSDESSGIELIDYYFKLQSTNYKNSTRFYHKPLKLGYAGAIVSIYKSYINDVILEFNTLVFSNTLEIKPLLDYVHYDILTKYKFGLVENLSVEANFKVLSIFMYSNNLETNLFILTKYTINNVNEYPIYVFPYGVSNHGDEIWYNSMDLKLMNKLSPLKLKNYEQIINQLKKMK